MATSKHLTRLAQGAEDVAATLRLFRGQHDETSSVTSITEAMGKLFGVSAALFGLADAQENPRYRSSLYRIQDDVDLMYRSAKLTVDAALDMVDRPADSQWMIWGDLNYRMTNVERVDFLDRLNWYQVFSRDLLDLLDGRSRSRLSRLREELQNLLRVQEHARSLGQTGQFLDSGSTPRPTPAISWTSPPPPRSGPRRPGSDFSDTARPPAPPPVPEPPLHSPTSTSSSTQTLGSSQTSSYGIPPQHWAENIFVGLQDGARTPFQGDYQLNIESHCTGGLQSDARYILEEEGFRPLAKVPFIDANSAVTFYLRPDDRRARILFSQTVSETDTRKREALYCIPLNTLRVIRNRSILQLCRASDRDATFYPWARLKFIYYERMVLFYSTIVALKRQDLGMNTPLELLEDPQDMNDEELFGGVIRAGNGMLHALRLFQCHGSGAVRLEARPFEGPMEEVPIWTAFLTKYVNQRDQDFVGLESQTVVTMCHPKPEPYVFVSGYRLPQTSDGNYYVLQFDSKRDASEFKIEWNRLCSTARRS